MTHSLPLRALAIALAVTITVGCGDEAEESSSSTAGAGAGNNETGSGGSGAGTGSGGLGPDPSPPSVELTFPLGAASTTQASLTVRGTVADVDGVATVTVNGADATLDGDTWLAEAPLSWGTQPLQIEVEDALGYVTSSEHGLVERAALISVAAGSQQLVVDDALYFLSGDALMGVRADGSRFGVAELPERDGRASIAWDAARDRFVVATSEELAAYDIATGTRTVLATSAGAPAEASFGDPAALAIDAANDRAIIIDDALGHLVAVDLTSGAKSIFVERHKAIFEHVISSTVDQVNGRLLIIDTQQVNTHGQVLSYALDDGDREVVSFSGLDEIDITGGWSMTTDGTTAWIATGSAVVELELDSGVRDILFNQPMWGEPDYLTINTVAHWGGELVIGSGFDNALYTTPLTTLDSKLLANNRFPAGEEAIFATNTNGRGGTAVASSNMIYTGQVAVALDLTTGTRTAIADVSSVYGHVLDEASGKLFGYRMSGFFDGEVVSIQPNVDVEWSVVAETGRGVAMVHDVARQRLLLHTETTITAIDLTDGATTNVFGSWNELRGAVIDETGDTLYVLESRPTQFDHEFPTVYAIDLDSGERTEIGGFTNWTFSSNDGRRFDLALDGDILIVPNWSEFLGGAYAVDVSSGEATMWSGIGDDNECFRSEIRFVSDDIMSYGGSCLLDRVTGEQVRVAR